MPPKKGKEGTRGAKQIVEENKSTLNFYKIMALTASGIAILKLCVFDTTTANTLWLLFACLVYIGCYQFMMYISRANLAENGKIIDSGVDLNIEGGISEHVKDLIILTTGCLTLSLYSNYFWYLWLFAPLRGGWMGWKNIIQPWFSQQQEAQPEVNEKKQKKMERRMKRMQQ